MKFMKKCFPFTGLVESKTSKAGKDYLSIAVSHSKKNQDGGYENVYINMIDKRDLLTLSALCETTYHKLCEEEDKEKQSKNGNSGHSNASSVDGGFDDTSIPF